MLAALPVRCHLQQAIKILALKPHNAEGINIAEFALAHRQRRAGYFNRIVERPLPPAERLQYPARLFATPAAQFSDGDRSVQTFYDLACMPLQQTLIGPGEAVLGQMADHFKERRAHIVVEILGWEFLLSRPGEPRAHVGREFISGISRDRMN